MARETPVLQSDSLYGRAGFYNYPAMGRLFFFPELVTINSGRQISVCSLKVTFSFCHPARTKEVLSRRFDGHNM